MGYYPTPEKVVDQVLARIAAPDEGKIIRLLDPGAGEGIALARFAGQISREFPGKVISYGVEPDDERAEAAKTRLGFVVKGGYETVAATNDAFSLLWFNPPYGETAAGERREVVFLRGQTRWLCPGGILVCIVPQRSLLYMAGLIATRFCEIKVERFGDEEYEAFEQAVVVAKKKIVPSDDNAAKEFLSKAAVSAKDLPSLDQEPDYCFTIPALRNEKITFTSSVLDQAEMAKAIPSSAAWESLRLLTGRDSPAELLKNPLLPLKKAHYATVIAAGALNGAVGKGDGRHLLVGFSQKVSETEETTTDKEKVSVKTEQYRGVTRIFTPTGAIVDLK